MFHVIQEEKIKELDPGTRFGNFDWSSDNQFIVFAQLVANGTSPFGETSTLWMMNPNGEALDKIDFPRDINVYNPRVSPSNGSILFLGSYIDRTSTYSDIFRYSIANGNLTQITNSAKDGINIVSFDWINDDNLIYSETASGNNDGQYRLWLADSDGNKIRPLYEGDVTFANLDVSPNGKKIAAVDLISRGQGVEPFNEVIIFDIEESGIQRIEETSSHGCGVTPRWSPNSELILYTVSACFPAPGGQVRITPADGSFDEMIYGTDSALGVAAVSPDGRFITFGTSESNNSADIPGVFKAELARPIPEFPFAAAIAALSIGSLVVVRRLRNLT